MMDELALAPSPSGSLSLEVQDIVEQEKVVEEGMDVEEEIDMGRGFRSSTKFRTWKRRQQRKAQRKRAAKARVVPSYLGRSGGPMRGAVTNLRFPSGGRGRGFVKLSCVSFPPVGRGRGIHSDLFSGSVGGPSGGKRGSSAPSMEADKRAPVPSVSSESCVSAPSTEAGKRAFVPDGIRVKSEPGSVESQILSGSVSAPETVPDAEVSVSALETVSDADVVVMQDSVATSVPDPFPDTEYLSCFDAHFHPDRLSAKTSKFRAGEPLAPGRMPDRRVLLVGGVMNFCDPHEFLSPQFEGNFDRDPKFKMAVGIHPKKAHVYSGRQWDAFLRLLNHPRVVGVSEVGLDFSVDPAHWRSQEDLFRRILGLGTNGFVLVMHLRGTQADPLGSVVYRLGHRLLRRHCSRYQRIHLHCFSGDEGMMRAWMDEFPNCFFGITGLIRSFSAQQRRALRAIPAERLLLETDSPHLKVHPEQVYNTPLYIGDLAQVVADVRGESLTDLLAISCVNGQRLYGP